LCGYVNILKSNPGISFIPGPANTLGTIDKMHMNPRADIASRNYEDGFIKIDGTYFGARKL